MNYHILLYQSVTSINNLTSWACAITIAGLTMRALRDFLSAYSDEDMGMKEAINKVKKRIFAVAIAITATSLIAFLRKYW